MDEKNVFLNGDKNRIFLNTNTGCSSQCSYCYLPDLNIDIGTNKTNKVSVDFLVQSLMETDYFISGKGGTILSIGCYSECWDEANKTDTIELLKKLLPLENPIQLSTKRHVKEIELSSILDSIQWYGQLSIYISNATISHWNEYEAKTTRPLKRFESFEIASQCSIPMYLYLKPVLPSITILDLDQYIDIIKKYDVNVILGEMFTSKRTKNTAPIGENKLFYQETDDEYQKINDALKKHVNVYKTSIEPILKKRGAESG